MRLPVISGVIDRRILVNYRIDPAALGGLLPEPFRPQVVHGSAIGGICLIRLREVRPRWWPARLGIRSENAAHRIAVEWEEGGELQRGVYVPRRDTSSALNALAGGRIFPGLHHRARFRVAEHKGDYRLAIDSDDGQTHVSIAAALARELPAGSLFTSLEEASDFFVGGSLGYSPAGAPGSFEGLRLETLAWQLEPLAVREVASSFFDDPTRFPAGSIEFDSAFLMRNIPHRWHSASYLRNTRRACTIASPR